MFAKYLPEFGWNPWIIARDFTSDDPRYDEKMLLNLPQEIRGQIIRIKHSIIDEQNYISSRNLIQKARDFFYPEYSNPPGVYFAAKHEAETLVSKQKINLILATFPDQWQITLGAYLAEKYNISFIADFRDIIEQEAGLKRSLRQRLQVYRFISRRWLTTRRAIYITTVSQYHQVILQRKLGKQTILIYNGFDQEEFKPQIIGIERSLPFRIIYVGRILNNWYQNPQILFESIDQLIFERKITEHDIMIEFYGSDREKLTSLMSSLRRKEFIKFYNRIPYSEVPNLLNRAQMLLLLTNNDRKGILTTKLFEYAGVKKPILCIPGDNGELDEFINQFNLGYCIKDTGSLKEKLAEWIASYKTGNFPQYNSTDVEFFTRKNQTKILAEVFNKVLEVKAK